MKDKIKELEKRIEALFMKINDVRAISVEAKVEAKYLKARLEKLEEHQAADCDLLQKLDDWSTEHACCHEEKETDEQPDEPSIEERFLNEFIKPCLDRLEKNKQDEERDKIDVSSLKIKTPNDYDAMASEAVCEIYNNFVTLYNKKRDEKIRKLFDEFCEDILFTEDKREALYHDKNGLGGTLYKAYKQKLLEILGGSE